MAYFDHQAAAVDKANAEKFEELKKLISSKDKNQKLNEFLPALMHIIKLEQQLENKEKQIAKYRQFFSLLNELTPKGLTIYDKLI